MREIVRALMLLALAVGWAGASPAEAARRVALVIGNGEYKYTERLQNTGNDAIAMGRALERLRFDKVTTLTNLTADGMRKALLAFEAEANGADIAMVFYAGHGIEVDGENYLIPVDARLGRAAAVEFEAIPLSNVTRMLTGAQNLRLVILDACRNNPFRSTMAADAGRKRSIGRGLKAVEPGDNELIAFAAAGGTEADDGSGRHSPFTQALLNHIERPNLEVNQLFRNVRDDVITSTGRAQRPHVYGTLGREQIFLNPAHKPVATASFSDETLRLRQENERLRRERELALLSTSTTTVARSPSAPGSLEIKDCETCPSLAVVPVGSFAMGGSPTEYGTLPETYAKALVAWRQFEGPQMIVSIPQALAVGKLEVSFAEWDACVADSGCTTRPDAPWGRGHQPVINVSWADAKQYTAWLSRKTGKPYRLLSEAEWEYVARAGTVTPYAFGDKLDGKHARFGASAPLDVGKLAANAWGIHDMHGNVMEWTEDCWNPSHAEASPNGAARSTGDCSRRVVRGGAWVHDAALLRAAFRARLDAELKTDTVGFRVVRPWTQ